MEYLNFYLRISMRSESEYTLRVESSPVGTENGTMRFPFDKSAYEQYRQSLESGRGAAEGMRSVDTEGRALASSQHLQKKPVAISEEIGQKLFNALMPETVYRSYRRSLDKAKEENKGLRLRLCIEPPELAVLSWEYLYDKYEEAYLCLSKRTPVLRYIDLDSPPPPLAVKPPIRILGMVASPSDKPLLNVAEEKNWMDKAVGHLVEKGDLELHWVKGTWRDLQKEMRNGPWHVFHFIGHGGFDETHDEGLIALTDEAGNTDPVDARTLRDCLADEQSMRLVVLNSCEGARASTTKLFSSIAAVLTRRGIAAVLSMQHKITDRAALEFSRTFYDALADGMPVEAAVTDARNAIKRLPTHTAEWGTPVLHLQSLDGVLFPIHRVSAGFQDAQQVASPPQTPSMEHPREAEYRPLSGEADSRRRDLMTLLLRVKQIWGEKESSGEGLSKQQVSHAAAINVDIEKIKGPVDNPLGTVPLRQPIGEYFHEQGRSLLILGEPGSGKTTTLLDLTRALIDRAERDHSQPIPVVLNLSSWRAQPFCAWAVDQLSVRYVIPEKQIRDWLHEKQLLLLFDGLDEVREAQRVACVEALNVFATEVVGLVGMAVCCRFKEYKELSVQLTLTAAVQLKLLSDQQVLQHVAAAGPDFAALHTVLQEDSGLRILARSPLMLGLMMQTYKKVPVEALAARELNTSTERRKELMAAYVAHMFKQATGERT